MAQKLAKEGVLSGEAVLALGVLNAGVDFVAGVPALPGNALMAELVESGAFASDRLLWYSSGKTAVEAAAGAAMAGKRAVACLRGSELLLATDALSSFPLYSGTGALILLTVDDPNGYFSHSLPDSRSVLAALGLPVLEVTSAPAGTTVVAEAMAVAEKYHLPVAVRYTAGFAMESFERNLLRPRSKRSSENRKNGTPLLVGDELLEAALHWKKRLDQLRERRNPKRRNPVVGSGEKGLIAAGYVAEKLQDVVDFDRYPFRLLYLEDVFPVPEKILRGFLSGVGEVLILEEGEPVVERQVRSLVQMDGTGPRVRGKMDYTIPQFGELQRWQLEDLLAQWHPGFAGKEFFFPSQEQPDLMPVEGFCRSCDYERAFGAVARLLREEGLQERALFVANPGCACREMKKLNLGHEIFFTPGSAIALGAALSRFEDDRLVFAVLGDTAVYHSGISGLIDAIAQKANLFVLILDNGLSVQTGLQPNPGSGKNAFGEDTPRVAIEDLLLAVDVRVEFVSVLEEKQFETAFRTLLGQAGVRVLIVKLPCYFREGEFEEPET